MSKERFKTIVAVYTLFERGDEILLARRLNTGYMDGMYGIPAGHHDGHQTLREAAARESKEEVGVMVDPADLEFVFSLHRPYAVDGDRLDFYFRVKKWQGEPKNLEPEKCDDLQWFKKSALPENVIPKLRLVFSGITSGETYGEVDDRV